MKYTPITIKVERRGKQIGTVVLDPGLHRRLHLFARDNGGALAEIIACSIAYAVGPESVEWLRIPAIIAEEDERDEQARRSRRKKEMEATKKGP